jgi:hypothetical protein
MPPLTSGHGGDQVNTTLKRIGERALVASGVPFLGRVRFRSRVLVLAYHNVMPDGTGLSSDASLRLMQREFARQLDVLVQTNDVVPIHCIFEPRKASGRSRVIITFDDAYSGALTAGVDELVQHGIPDYFRYASLTGINPVMGYSGRSDTRSRA